MPKILICGKLSEPGLELLRREPGFQVDVESDLPSEKLIKIISTYDALTVRSDTKVTEEVLSHAKKLKVVIIDSENASMPGYLRSQQGGRFDVVAQWMSSGHVNILTRPTKHIDLRSLTALLRTEELNLSGKSPDVDIRYLAKTGRLPEVPEWYYDQATNSIQNGGLNPKEIEKTKISRFSLRKLIEVGLSEALWNPLR